MRFGKSENGCSLVKPHEFELHSLDAMGEAVASDVVKEQGALDQSSRQAYEQAIAFLKKSLLEQDTVISNLHNTNKQLREKLEEYDDADFDYLRKIDECKAIVEKSIEEKVNLIRQKYAESFQDKLISESGKLKALNNKLLFRIKDLKKVRVQNDILQSKIKDLKNSHALKIHQLTRVHNANVLQLKESITRLNKRVGEANKKIISLEVGKVTQDKVNQEIENKFQENIAKLAAKRKQCKVLSKSNEKLNSDVNSLQGKLNLRIFHCIISHSIRNHRQCSCAKS